MHLKLLTTVVIIFHLNLVFFVNQSKAQIKFAKVDSLPDCIKYLIQFGYLKDLQEVAALLNPTSLISPNAFDPSHPAASALRLALSKFQQYTKLPVTGQFDAPTKAKMNTPRCGNKDILQIGTPVDINTLVRKKRYVASNFKWQKRELTYKISKFSESEFSPEIIQREVDRAFEMWSNVTNLYFIRSDNAKTVDIDMRFARLAHGDIEPFDGRGITLAHAFPPGPDIGGDVHFDDDEIWTSMSSKGSNFQHVVVHELGHALGLRHSDVEEAIMYAYARSYDPSMKLHEDDIEGIQSLYGKRGDPMSMSQSTTSTTRPSSVLTSPTSTSTTTTTKRPMNDGAGPRPDLCFDSKLDAITSLENGEVYAFKGNYAFRIDPTGGGIMHRYTEKTSYVFYGLPGDIDAALTYNGLTYFFKGKYYWRYINRKLDGQPADFPKLISKDFVGIPDDLDAAFTWLGDMYFFKSDKYWSFNPSEKPPVAKNYPLPISQWYGLPTKDIDAAFTSPEGPLYFFKDGNYYLFDDENFQVAEANPPYPRSTRVMWLGCTPYRPDVNEIKQGWIKRTVEKLKGAVNEVKTHFDKKFRKISGWFG